MKIFRFDEEVSVPVIGSGSDFKMGRLTDEDSRVRVGVMYLPPGGRVGRRETAASQLFAVVAGAGWVSGADGARREVGAGYGAVWERGESLGAGTDSGLTAVAVDGEFVTPALVITKEIIVSDYDPRWPAWFEQIRGHVWPAVAGIAERIEHVGSTSVPGLAAKPIIDMDIVVASDADVQTVIGRLAGIGYTWAGDLGVTGREAFQEPRGRGLPRHHLYLVVENSKAHLDHVLLRDLMRADPAARERYAALKRRNAETANDDIEVYVAAKADFVTECIDRARSLLGHS
jgi:GrpB-like predicted nucleotidyltransferase (UPF0157 family)